jgi:hypothetical protein
MLTDLSFLNIGQQWPPKSELERLNRYERNRQLFENKHEQVYAQSFKRIQRVINNFEDIVSYEVIVNFQKLISLKIADLLLGEPPKITAGNDDSKEQITLDNIIDNSDLVNTAYTTAIDVSRYGDGIFYVYKDIETNTGVIDVTQPSFWFKVVNPENLRKVQYNVLAWTYSSDVNQKGWFGTTNTEKQKFLKVQIHSKGQYQDLLFKLNDQSIISSLIEDKTIKTGLKDFAVVPVNNLLTSDRAYGFDDYTDIDSIISELEVRISQISKILDKHAEPSVQGPSSALTRNIETGQWELKMGNYFPRDTREDPEVSYITWEAQLEANFKLIEQLINLLYTISEMGSALLGDTTTKTGQIASGTALRRMMISPLAKVNRIRMRFDSSLKKAIKLCSQLGGDGIIDLSKEKINIYWNDGLPTDPVEEAEIMAKRTGDKPTISQFSAIQRLDNLNDEDTQAELDAIVNDEAKSNPLANINYPFVNKGDDE